MPVQMVANNMAGPTVFVDEESGTEITWGRKNDPAGEDIQPCSEAVLGNAHFMRAMRKGVYSIVTEEEANERFELQRQSWEQRMYDDEHAAEMFMDDSRQNDILSFQCVGPGANGRGQCRERVSQRQRNAGELPPLCGVHAHLRNNFVASPDPSGQIGDDGKVITTWLPIQV
jgi:hypothetical protein